MPSLYITMRTLPAEFYPVRFLRTDTVTLEIIDTRCGKPEFMAAVLPLLQLWEHEVGRAAYGQPPPGLPVSDELMRGLVLPYVPPALRVPGEPAIQNPQLATAAGREAYRDARDWEALELHLVGVVA